MNYFTKSDNNTDIPVHLESVSPSGNYFVGWHTYYTSIPQAESDGRYGLWEVHKLHQSRR